MSACRYCGESIRFVHTETDRRMPLNASPDPNGNVIMREGRAHVLAAGDDTRGQRWMPHAATCPYAGQRRGRARGGRR